MNIQGHRVTCLTNSGMSASTPLSWVSYWCILYFREYTGLYLASAVHWSIVIKINHQMLIIHDKLLISMEVILDHISIMYHWKFWLSGLTEVVLTSYVITLNRKAYNIRKHPWTWNLHALLCMTDKVRKHPITYGLYIMLCMTYKIRKHPRT